eukprot:Ihof_evm8s34 gene=Ihof_evmTU8s34
MPTRVRRDRDQARSAGNFMLPIRNRIGTVQFRGHNPGDPDIPIGINFFPYIVTAQEQDTIMEATSTMPEEKRTPWPTEELEKNRHTWIKRRMGFQTIYNHEDNDNPGSVLLKKDPGRHWPMEALTERVGRLSAIKAGCCLELVGMEASWMKGTDFPIYKDHPDKEGWGDVISYLSLGSSGDVVIKDPVTNQTWCIYVESGDLYTL